MSLRTLSFRTSVMIACAAAGLSAGTLATTSGCSPASAEWPNAHELPDDVRADYDVFALRCSKCHSLARPLNSGIDDDTYWQRYVARMRRQPGSGISADDSVKILRFLHFYAREQRKAKGLPVAPEPADSSAPSVAAPGSGAAPQPVLSPPPEPPLPPPPPAPASPFAPPSGSAPPSP